MCHGQIRHSTSSYSFWRKAYCITDINNWHPVSLERITGRFDDVVLEKAGEEFRVGHDLDNFPKLPVFVGGDTDILLGT